MPVEPDETAIDPALSRLVAERLTMFRKRAELEISDITRIAGISRTGVLKMEDPNKSNPKVSTLSRYLSACRVTLFEFYDHEFWIPPREQDSHAIREFRSLLNKAEPDRRKQIITVLALISREVRALP